MVALVIVSFSKDAVLSAFSTNDLLSDVSAGFNFFSSSTVDFFPPGLDFPFLSFNAFFLTAYLLLFSRLNLKHNYQPSVVVIGIF